MKISKELIDFVYTHRHDDSSELALRNDRRGDLDYLAAYAMIDARKKLENKLPEWAEYRDVVVPSAVMVEQASSSETARYKSSLVGNPKLLLDMSGGLGVDSVAFSKVAETVHYLEREEVRVLVAQHNFKSMGITNIITHAGSAEVEGYQLIRELQPDTIFIDPDRRPNISKGRTFLPEECTPDVTNLLPHLFSLSPTSVVWIKFSPMLDMTQLCRSVTGVEELHVISLRRECKELLAKVTDSIENIEPKIFAVELMGGEQEIYPANRSYVTIDTDHDQECQWVYEPYSSIAKIGMNYFGPYDVWQPDANTHLYMSRKEITSFPGRAFKVIEQGEWSKRVMKRFSGDDLHVVAKNFPERTEELRQRLGTEGRGNRYLFLFRSGKKKVYVLAESKD